MDAYINEDDMYILLTTNCSILKDSAEKRSSNISQSKKGKISIDDATHKAQKRLEREERERRLQQQRDEEELEKWEEEQAREHVYSTRKRQANDFSFLFEGKEQKQQEDDLPFL
jgi:hypothetical protein